MNSIYIPAVAAFGGSAFGAISTIVTGWVTRRRRLGERHHARSISKRERLYRSSSRSLPTMPTRSQQQIEFRNFHLYALIGRMSFCPRSVIKPRSGPFACHEPTCHQPLFVICLSYEEMDPLVLRRSLRRDCIRNPLARSTSVPLRIHKPYRRASSADRTSTIRLHRHRVQEDDRRRYRRGSAMSPPTSTASSLRAGVESVVTICSNGPRGRNACGSLERLGSARQRPLLRNLAVHEPRLENDSTYTIGRCGVRENWHSPCLTQPYQGLLRTISAADRLATNCDREIQGDDLLPA